MSDDIAPMTEVEFARATGATGPQVAALATLRDRVVARNDRMNLVGPSFASDFWRRHALDSAQLFHVEHQAVRWADVGAGAGFPGIVLAILLKGKADAQVHLVESMEKRVRFLREVCDELQLPTEIHHARAEALKPVPGVDVVTARACAPLSRLLGYTCAFFRDGARGAFLKGRDATREIAEARQAWAFEASLTPSLSDPSGRIVRISKVAPRG